MITYPCKSSLLRAFRLFAVLAFVCIFFVMHGVHAQSAIPAPQDETPDTQALTDRIQHNSQRMDVAQQTDDRLSQMLASIPSPSQGEVDDAQRKSEQLVLALAAAENTLQNLQKADPVFTNSVANLEKRLADVQKERNDLNDKLTQLSVTNSTSETNGLEHEVLLQNLQPIPILLVENRVVPIMAPFYDIESGNLKVALTGEIVPGIVATRVDDGESIANAVQPGGLLDALAKRSDPATAYFKFIVCSDSVLAFQKAVQAVTSRGFAYAWDTGKDQNIMQRTDQQPEHQDERGYFPEK